MITYPKNLTPARLAGKTTVYAAFDTSVIAERDRYRGALGLHLKQVGELIDTVLEGAKPG